MRLLGPVFWYDLVRVARRQRLALWRHGLVHVPSEQDIELGPLARDFELAGGAIRSAVVTAAYLAAKIAEAASERARGFTWSTTAARLRRLYADLTARTPVSCS